MGSETRERRYRFDVRDIVLIALLSAVGGVLSTYVGYLGNLINRLFGVPFGAGQLIAGLHILWPLLARAFVGRFGAGTLTGLTKGAVELFSGGTHGVIILLISSIEGLFVDLGLSITPRRSLVLTMVTGAVASASNVLVFQAIYFSGASMAFIGVMIGLSLISGAFFGGYLAWDLEKILVASRIVRTAAPQERRRPAWWRVAGTLSLVLALLAGAIYYYVDVYRPFAPKDVAEVTGAVESSYRFVYEDWSGSESTVNSEMKGSVTYVPAQDYVGFPLKEIVDRAGPEPGATEVRIVAADGYEARFTLGQIESDPKILLTLDGERLRLVAPGFDGAYWVEQVIRIVVE
jgi:ABC-type thiamin/hydroxymethylpyrimidine transport system permease subunit